MCAAAAFFIFLPFLVVDKGLFQYCGDFNSQQIPFYTYMNGFVKNSAGQWSWETDLGTSAVNSYSFYLYGSPFFWLTTLLPQAWVPFSMVPMFMLKFGVAGLGAYTYLKRYSAGRNYAVIGACLYALSGFTVYNTFFNHFVDCIALFPFLLWALDSYVYDGVRGVFPLAVAVNLLNNYFFFAGQIVFLFLYFFIKLLTGEYRITPGRFGRLAFESLLGVALGCLFLWPAVLCLKDNPRTVDLSSGFGFLLYGRVQQYFAILASLFLPPDPTYLPQYLYRRGGKAHQHDGVSAGGELRGRVGVYESTQEKRVYKNHVGVPYHGAGAGVELGLLRAQFQLLRTLVLYAHPHHVRGHHAGAAGRGDRPDGGPAARGRGNAAVRGIRACAQAGGRGMELGVVKEQSQFWLTYLTAVLGLLIFYGVIRWCRGHERFTRVLLAGILGFSVFYSVAHIARANFRSGRA